MFMMDGGAHAAGRPLIVHVIHRFGLGGTEHGMLNLVNSLPPDVYRHAIVALTDIDASFAARLRPDVELIALHKPPGHGYKAYPRLFETFRRLRPSIVHTRNLAALEAQLPAWAARVPIRIHGEHGWDISDPGGTNRAMRLVRRAYRPFVSHYVAVARDLAAYLGEIGVVPSRVTTIHNGVDTRRYRPPDAGRERIEGCSFGLQQEWIIGTVGRMHAVKDQVALARAFVRALEIAPEERSRLRLVMVGDGPLREEAARILEQAGVGDLAWLPGARADVPAILRGLDCFVLPSRAEGLSNSILEAMASGLPVVATDVGGNGELIERESTGILVPPLDIEGLAHGLLAYARDTSAARAAGRLGRSRIEAVFSLDAMVERHLELYGRLLRGVPDRSRIMAAHDGSF